MVALQVATVYYGQWEMSSFPGVHPIFISNKEKCWILCKYISDGIFQCFKAVYSATCGMTFLKLSIVADRLS